MSRLRIRTTAGATPADVQALALRSGPSTTSEVKRVWICTNAELVQPQEPTEPPFWEYTWELVNDWVPPPQHQTPGLSPASSDLDESGTIANFPQFVADGSIEATYFREIEYWKDGVLIFTSAVTNVAEQDHQDWRFFFDSNGTGWGGTYQCRMRFVGLAGPGPWSGWSNSVTLFEF